MTICIAGKNDIAIEIAAYIEQHFPQHEIVGLTNRNDTGLNGYFRSFKWYLRHTGIKELQLVDLYPIKNLIFLSLEFDRIIKPSKFATDRLFNIHFSLLPAYKGMFTSAWPILNCESHSGVTLHEIDSGIDTGDIIDQEQFKLQPTETVQTLYRKYMEVGIALVKKNLPTLLANSYQKTIQPHRGSTYYSKDSIDYRNLRIDLKTTAERLDAQIRAFTYREYQIPEVHGIKIHKARITNQRSAATPGTVMQENEFELTIATIDYDVILYKDRFDDFILACQKDDVAEVRRLLPFVNLEERTKEGWTPLIIASYNNAVEVASILIENGANVNASNYKGTSVVMYAKDAAINSHSYAMLDLILACKPDLAHRDFFNKDIFDYVVHQSTEVYNHIKAQAS